MAEVIEKVVIAQMDIVVALVIFVGLLGLAGLTFWVWSQTSQRKNDLCH